MHVFKKLIYTEDKKQEEKPYMLICASAVVRAAHLEATKEGFPRNGTASLPEEKNTNDDIRQ